MGDVVHTSEWTYQGVECACITVWMAEQSRYIGYISIGDNSIEVMDTETPRTESDAMNHIEQEVDSIIDYASGLTDPDSDADPPGPHFMSCEMDDDTLSTIEEIMEKHKS